MKTVLRLGPARGGLRIYEDGARALVRVAWRERGVRRFQSFPLTPRGRKEAKAWAEEFYAARTAPPRPGAVPMRELWRRYAEAEFPHLRPKTQRLYAARWRPWEIFVGHARNAAEVTPEELSRFAAAYGQAHVINQVAEHVKLVKLVFAWARRARVLRHNDLADFRFRKPKDAVEHEPAEYRRADFEALLAALDPHSSRQWRPWAVLLFVGSQGVRINAALHLRWADVELPAARVQWPKQTDKMGRAWTQPLRVGALQALATARWWRERDLPAGDYVFYSPQARRQGAPYQVQAFWAALVEAERRAGVPHLELRAAHGLRKMVAGDVLTETGDPKLALDFIGDRDVKVMLRYLKTRGDRLEEVAARLDTTPESGTRAAPTPSAEAENA